MNKNLLSVLLATLVLGSTSAETLSPSEALRRAAGDTNLPAKVRSFRASSKIVPALTLSEDETPMVYVFSGEGEGYLVVSADDVAAPVLGYSDSGVLDTENLPDNLAWWLGQYSSEIAAASSAGASVYSSSSRATERGAIEPMLTSKWNQDAPYNLLAPLMSGTRCVTGCVATAMAQVMNYHKWPAKGQGSNSYSWGGSTLEMDFSKTVFDWPNILDSYTPTASNVQIYAVATLMSACGISVDMDYDTSASGAQSYDVGAALLSYFNYDQGLRYAYRQYYTLAEWENAIYDDLVATGPVYYAGHSSEGGHAFVCDGYSSDGYFHFNWGWGGLSDGYFRLNALDPGAQGIGGSSSGYNSNQMVILGVKRPDAQSVASAPTICSLYPLAATVSGTVVTFPGWLLNLSPRNLSGAIVARFSDSTSGSATDFTLATFTNLGIYRGYSGSKADIANLPDGSYRLTLITSTASGEYDVLTPVDGSSYLLVTKQGSTVTVTSPEASLYRIDKVDVKSEFYIGHNFSVSAEALYSGNEPTSLTLTPCLYAEAGSLSPVATATQFTVELQPGEPYSFDCIDKWEPVSKNSLSAGDYYFSFARQIGSYAWEPVSTPVKVTLQSNPGTPSISCVKWNVVSTSDAADIVSEITIRCTAGYYSDPISIYIYPTTGNDEIPAQSTEPLFIGKGEEKTYTVHSNLSDYLVSGIRYEAYLWDNAGDNWLTFNPVYFTLTQSGIEDITVAGASSVSISPNPASEIAVVSAPEAITGIDIVSLSGATVTPAVDIDGESATIHVSALPSGIYVARVVTLSGVYSAKLIRK